VKHAIAVALLLAFSSSGLAQIKVDGPQTGTVGYRVKAKLTVTADDFKIKCFPSNDDWMGIVDFEGNKWIDFVPGRKILVDPKAPNEQVKPKLFTFVVAGNKGGKTFLETWEVTISPDSDVVPVPTPVPGPSNKLAQDLKAAYLVSPNATAKTKLLGVYEKLMNDAAADRFTNFKQAVDQLSTETPLAIGSDLRSVRDVVADYLAANVSQSGSQWDKNRLVNALRLILEALRSV
jgi:hypothetical protein